MEFDMIYKQKKNLIVAQALGAVFGVVLALIDLILAFGETWSSFGNALREFVLLPVTFAASLRFCVRTYQIAKVKFGTKVYDSTGGYFVIERRGRGIAASIIAFFLLVGIIAELSVIHSVLFVLACLAAVAVGAFFCYKDIRFFVNYKRELDEQQEM